MPGSNKVVSRVQVTEYRVPGVEGKRGPMIYPSSLDALSLDTPPSPLVPRNFHFLYCRAIAMRIASSGLTQLVEPGREILRGLERLQPVEVAHLVEAAVESPLG